MKAHGEYNSFANWLETSGKQIIPKRKGENRKIGKQSVPVFCTCIAIIHSTCGDLFLANVFNFLIGKNVVLL